MAVRNFWSLEPGEAIFAEELNNKFKTLVDLYFPLRDTGIDLIVVTKETNKVVTFQIKESRYYEEKNHAWHQEYKKNLDKNIKKVDFYIFLIYLPGHLAKTKKKNTFKKYFVIIPSKDLTIKMKSKKPTKKGKYNFYFSFVNDITDKIYEIRETGSKNNPAKFDYSEYLNAWGLIKRRLK